MESFHSRERIGKFRVIKLIAAREIGKIGSETAGRLPYKSGSRISEKGGEKPETWSFDDT